MPLLSQPTSQQIVDATGIATPGWSPFFSAVFRILTAITQSGTTAQRPTVYLWVGREYFDSTLGFPIWYVGPGWVNSAGAPA